MESSTNPDPTALALQIQSLSVTVEELTRQNQEMKQWLLQESNRADRGDDEDSNRRRTSTPEEASSDLLKEMRKEMDKLRNAIKGKMYQSLERIVRKMDSPFTMAV